MGGTTWEEALKDWNGIDPRPRQKHLGNQWSDFRGSGFVPRYTVINLGSNNVDTFQRDIANATLKAKGSRPDWEVLDDWVVTKFNELKPHVIRTMDYLKHYLPATEFLYVKINPRH